MYKWMIWGYHYFWKHPYRGFPATKGAKFGRLGLPGCIQTIFQKFAPLAIPAIPGIFRKNHSRRKHRHLPTFLPWNLGLFMAHVSTRKRKEATKAVGELWLKPTSWRISKWLGSPPFIIDKVRPFGRGPTTRSLGDNNDHYGKINR